MRTLSTLATIFVLGASLSACSKPAPVVEATTDSVATDVAMSATGVPAAAARTDAALPMAGKYEATTSDGKTKNEVTISADGAYKSIINGGLPVAGIVKRVDGKTCFNPSGGKPAECYTDTTPAADGSFTATAADGTVMTVKPVK